MNTKYNQYTNKTFYQNSYFVRNITEKSKFYIQRLRNDNSTFKSIQEELMILDYDKDLIGVRGFIVKPLGNDETLDR